MNSSSQPAAGGGKIKLYLIGAAVVLILGAILYFVGLQAGKAQLAAQAAEFGVERNGLNAKISDAEAARDAALERSALMEARAALYHTAIDMEKLNLGDANEHLKESSNALSRVKNAEVAPLRAKIDATDLKVVANLQTQRAQVLGFAEQLNAMMPVEIETTVPMATSDAPADVNSAPPAVPDAQP